MLILQNEGLAMDTTMGTFTFFILLYIERQPLIQTSLLVDGIS